ncbi:MAG TPA: hypothetical protein H9694_00400 [Firmicutes bacterium]|nr:hypothetical protein [Bacillota bacterium]
MTLASIQDPGGTMARGYRRCFWGTFLLLFHVNIGPVPIFPDFVGLLVLLSGLNQLRMRAGSPGLWRAAVMMRILCGLSAAEFLLLLIERNGLPLPASGLVPLSALYHGLYACLYLAAVYEILNASCEILAIDRLDATAAGTGRRLRIFLVLSSLAEAGLWAAVLFTQVQAPLYAALASGLAARVVLLACFAHLRRAYLDFPSLAPNAPPFPPGPEEEAGAAGEVPSFPAQEL